MKLSVPGDKSISHRAAILAALSDGLSTITGFLESEDCLNTVAVLQQLGVNIEHPSPGKLIVHGTRGIFQAPSQPLECGNSGTTMRLLAGLLAAQPFSSQLTGDNSLSARPMLRVMEPLAMMGALIDARGDKNRPPLFIDGKNLQPICYELPVASAQVKSAILLAALFTNGTTTIIEPTTCRDHTERMFDAFQIQHRCTLDEQGRRIIKITGPQIPTACDIHVPGDISSAAFWMVATAANVDSHVQIENVGLNPTRTGMINVLQRMGAQFSITNNKLQGEPSGTITVHGVGLTGTIIEGTEIPNVIDELPILAVAGVLAHGTTIIKDASELRVKETDRITAIVTNLRALGADIIEHDDGMEIHGGKPLQGAIVKSYGDHRIAMGMAIAGLFTTGKVIIDDTACIATSYPGFEETLALLSNGVTSSEYTRHSPLVTRCGVVEQRLRIIAIDGPAASGKSSVARALARKLGFLFVSSGHFYRAITWIAKQHSLAFSDTSQISILSGLQSRIIDGTVHLFFEEKDLAEHLSDPAVNTLVSQIAAMPAVRSFVFQALRALAKNYHLVIEGRDIGSIVFPETPWKFYLDASPEERARRRTKEGTLDAIEQRDQQDTTRSLAPLVIPQGAIVIDTTKLSIEEVVEKILTHIKKEKS